jgi:hypothetical protein
MADLRNIRNTGVVVGGDVTRSAISVGFTGAADGNDEAMVLQQLDTLLNELLAGVGQLPAERAGQVASDAVRLKGEIVKPGGDRDPGRIRALLGTLAAAAASVVPLAEIVTDITELVSRLPH